MAIRKGKYTVELTGGVVISCTAGVAGKKESEGPLREFFDKTFADDRMGESSWEKAESALQTAALDILLQKAGVMPSDIDILFAGDLMPQCIASTFALRDFGIQSYGQFGACSTMAQALSVGAVFVESGAAQRAAAVTSSHFCSAERQFRMPIEYGGQRQPTAQWTVTGAGAALLERGGRGVMIKRITPGRITDMKLRDTANMGAAMAPAAADTLLRFFSDTDARPADFDLILTGDLGTVGSRLLNELLLSEGLDISANHSDCGCMIYDISSQDVHAGGSGCGCCASVFCSHIMPKLRDRELKNILFIATGALMSPTSSQQGESIPSIAHLVQISTV